MVKGLVAILIFLSISLLMSEAYSDEVELKKLRDGINEQYFSFDTSQWKQLLKTAIVLRNGNPNDWRLSYYCGVICHQLGKILYNPDAEQAYYYFDKSIDYLLEVKKKNYTAEIAALLSSAYGKKSSLSSLKAIYFGLKAKDYIYEANGLDRFNPKVFLVAAIHLMHTPESFGGDKKWSERLLKSALKLNYKKQKVDDLLIDWATEGEIYAYLAQLEVLRGNFPKAKLYIDKALKLVPDYGFVLYDLIPQMGKKE